MLSEKEQHYTLPPLMPPLSQQHPPQLQEVIQPPGQQPTFASFKQQNDLILNSAKKISYFRVLGRLLKKLECFKKCSRRDSAQETSFYTKHKKEIFAVLSFGMTLFVFFNYQTLKEHCPFESQSDCLQKFILLKIKVWLPKIVVNCILGLLQVHFLIYGSTYRVIPMLGVLEILVLYVFSDQTISPNYYIGAINFVQLSLLAILLMFYLFLASLIFCAYKNKFVFYLFMCLVIVAAILLYIFVVINSCQNWEKGINGKIQRIQGLCGIKPPSYCWNKILDGYFRLDWIFKDCYLSSAAKKNYNRFFEIPRSAGPFIAYANPNTFTELQRTDTFMQNSTFKYAMGFQTLNQAKNSSYKPDIVFDSLNQTYYIDVQKNESLIKERTAAWQRAQDSDPPLANNVIFMYVDAISRESAHILLPKIVNWFQKQSSFKSYQQKDNNRKDSEVKTQTFQFYRYSSLKPWTQPNEFTMMYGVNIEDPADIQQHSQKIISSMTKAYMQKGYITGSANSFCQAISANLEEGALYAFETTRYDHESQSFACDPNFQDPSNIYSFVQGPYSSGKRCLYGKTIVEYVSEYTYSFFRTYKDQPKFFSMHFLQGHEGTGESPKNLDVPLSNLLEKLESNGLLQDTMVMLVSDHGLHMQGVLYAVEAESFLIEKNLPVLMVRAPKRMNRKYRDKIRMNQQYVITSKNVHHFLKHIVEGDNYRDKTMSLLSDLTANDSCPKVGIANSTHCSCKQ